MHAMCAKFGFLVRYETEKVAADKINRLEKEGPKKGELNAFKMLDKALNVRFNKVRDGQWLNKRGGKFLG